jgi:hypothetical protein
VVVDTPGLFVPAERLLTARATGVVGYGCWSDRRTTRTEEDTVAFDYAAKIQALLAKAASCRDLRNDEEASMFQAKAEELMDKYRIAEEEALAVDPQAVSPISKKIVIKTSAQGQGDLSGFYIEMFRNICRHTGVRMYIEVTRDWSQMGTVVGYEGDVRYTEFLWTAALMMFSTRIDPTWDRTKDEDENIFILRQAGIERRRIADMAWGTGDDAAARSKVQRIYKREAARRGEDIMATGLGFTTATYRQAYAQAFVNTLNRRLRDARDAADSVGGALVLTGRMERVDEAFYEMFPNLRPRPADEMGVWVDPRESCDRCKKAKTVCREHSHLRDRTWTQADERRWQAQNNSSSARAGRASGTTAAEGVILSRTERAGRLDPSGVAIEG